jgi:hypothetical protein
VRYENDLVPRRAQTGIRRRTRAASATLEDSRARRRYARNNLVHGVDQALSDDENFVWRDVAP